MRVLVTGAVGGLGSVTVHALRTRGHDVLASDARPPSDVFPWWGEIPYLEADLTHAGDAHSVVRGIDAVVHAAAIPTPEFHPPHVVFGNNLLATFNLVEAAVRAGVRRFVNVSSETVPGFIFAERPFRPEYAPVDEQHPVRPQDPYALAKRFGEQLLDAAVERSDMACVSIRPSWIWHEAEYERNLALVRADPAAYAANLWSYVDSRDVASALSLAVESQEPGHRTYLVAAPDNFLGEPLATLVRSHTDDSVPLRTLSRDDSSGITSALAEAELGWRAEHTWASVLRDLERDA